MKEKSNNETTTYLVWGAACTHLLLNVMRSKLFLSHLILTLSWCLKERIRSRWKKFALSYNSFFCVVQITFLVTAIIRRNTTRFSPFHRGKTNVEQHELFDIDASRSLPDKTLKRANLLAVVEGVQSHFFHLSAAAGANRHICQTRHEGPVVKGQCIPSEI